MEQRRGPGYSHCFPSLSTEKESWESGPELLFGWIEPILPPENWDLGLQPLDFSALSGRGCLFLCSRVKIRPGATSPLPGSPTK